MVRRAILEELNFNIIILIIENRPFALDGVLKRDIYKTERLHFQGSVGFIVYLLLLAMMVMVMEILMVVVFV